MNLFFPAWLGGSKSSVAHGTNNLLPSVQTLPYWTQDVGCSVRDSSTSATVEGDEGAELPGGQTLSSALPGVLVIHGDIRCVCVPLEQGVKVGVGGRSCYCTKIGCMTTAKNCKQQ